MSALIGSGDSGKSTILDGIDLALSSRWNPQLSDNDFYKADTSEIVLIEVTVGALPSSLVTDRKYGMDLRGVSPLGEVHDEPAMGDQEVLTIRFTIGADLEPGWFVVTDRQSEPKAISAKDRGLFGTARIDENPQAHFSWSRGSALLSLTEDAAQVPTILAEAQRRMRASVGQLQTGALAAAVTAAKAAAADVGAGPTADNLSAALNLDAVAARGSGLALHDQVIPLQRSGRATQRLVAMAIQQSAVTDGSITLVDEIEAGLEPFRLRHLLRHLTVGTEVPDGTEEGTRGQVILTTHSPAVLEELPANAIHLVRRNAGGKVSVAQIPESLQAVLRAIPESFLGRKVLVCEGKTELGMCRAMERQWSIDFGRGRPLAHVGVVLALGGGQETGMRAQAFRNLGFDVAVIADSDKPLSPTSEVLSGQGVTVRTWDGEVSTERRICTDVPLAMLQQVVDVAIEDRGLEAVRDALGAIAKVQIFGESIEEWLGAGRSTEPELRATIADAATSKKNPWFKRTDLGESIGRVLTDGWASIQETDLAKKLSDIGEWAYRE